MKRYYLFKPLQIIKKRERTELKGYSPLLPNAMEFWSIKLKEFYLYLPRQCVPIFWESQGQTEIIAQLGITRF